MHTELKLKATLKEIVFLFDSTHLVNIRNYKSSSDIPDEKGKFPFELTIRHNEDEKPRELINKALKIFKLKAKLNDLKDKLDIANERENQVLANRGWGHAMRCTKIGFSTTRTDNLKARIKVVKEELETLTK